MRAGASSSPAAARAGWGGRRRSSSGTVAPPSSTRSRSCARGWTAAPSASCVRRGRSCRSRCARRRGSRRVRGAARRADRGPRGTRGPLRDRVRLRRRYAALVPALVRAVVGSLRDGDDAVVPVIGGRPQPLLAAYRVALAPRLRELLVAGPPRTEGRPRNGRVRSLSEAELLADDDLAAADPDLRSALNANTPEEWARSKLCVESTHASCTQSVVGGRVCVESTQTLAPPAAGAGCSASAGRLVCMGSASAGRLGLHLAALHEERLAVRRAPR